MERSPLHDPGFVSETRDPREPEHMPRIANGYRFSTPQEKHRETRHLAHISRNAPRIEWSQFHREIFQWKPGEHVGLIGPTGTGKTTLMLNIINLHEFVAMFATKPRDRTMDYLIHRMGYVKFERWQSLDALKYPRRVLWPNATRINSDEQQKIVFHHAFSAIYREGGWTVGIDELWWVCQQLGLTKDVKVFLQQARSLDISLLCGTQRPAWVPVEVYDMSTHLFFWKDNDERNLSRLGGISWLSAHVVKNAIARLDEHQVLYINTRSGEMFRTRCPGIPNVGGEK